MFRISLLVGALVGALSVMLGAFGAHGLRELLTEKALGNWHTACTYMMYHALAILLVAVLMRQQEHVLLKWTVRFFFIGMLFFSGSLYLLSMRDILGHNFSWLGPVTPLGGLLFIAGWCSLALYGFRYRK